MACCGLRAGRAPGVAWKWRRNFRHKWLAAIARMTSTSKYFMSILQEGRNRAARRAVSLPHRAVSGSGQRLRLRRLPPNHCGKCSARPAGVAGALLRQFRFVLDGCRNIARWPVGAHTRPLRYFLQFIPIAHHGFRPYRKTLAPG